MRIRIRPAEVVIPDDCPFRNDLLDRKKPAEVLTQLVDGIDGPCVLTIDAPWGAGKTTFTKMLAASDRMGCTERRRAALPAPVISRNFWMVVITVLPVGCSRIRRRSRTLSARSGFGNPQAVNTPAICRSSLVRSVTMTTAGCRCAASRRSLSASHSIVRLLPEPWVCQTIPPRALGWRAVPMRRNASFTAMNCL